MQIGNSSNVIIPTYSCTVVWFWLHNIKKREKRKNKQDIIAIKASVTKGNCNMQKG